MEGFRSEQAGLLPYLPRYLVTTYFVPNLRYLPSYLNMTNGRGACTAKALACGAEISISPHLGQSLE